MRADLHGRAQCNRPSCGFTRGSNISSHSFQGTQRCQGNRFMLTSETSGCLSALASRPIVAAKITINMRRNPDASTFFVPRLLSVLRRSLRRLCRRLARFTAQFHAPSSARNHRPLPINCRFISWLNRPPKGTMQKTVAFQGYQPASKEIQSTTHRLDRVVSGATWAIPYLAKARQRNAALAARFLST